MEEHMRQIIIRYLQSVVAFNPVINAQDGGQCIYCGTELDRLQPHKPDCHYLEAKRLLKEFKEKERDQEEEIKTFDLHKDIFSNKNQKEWIEFFYKNLTEQTPLILFGKGITVTQIFWIKPCHIGMEIIIRFSNGTEFKFDSFDEKFLGSYEED